VPGSRARGDRSRAPPPYSRTLFFGCVHVSVRQRSRAHLNRKMRTPSILSDHAHRTARVGRCPKIECAPTAAARHHHACAPCFLGGPMSPCHKETTCTSTGKCARHPSCQTGSPPLAPNGTRSPKIKCAPTAAARHHDGDGDVVSLWHGDMGTPKKQGAHAWWWRAAAVVAHLIFGLRVPFGASGGQPI